MRNLEDTFEKSLGIGQSALHIWESYFQPGFLPQTHRKLQGKSPMHPMFSGAQKLGSWIDVANAFNDFFASHFKTSSYETRKPDDSQSRIFFNDFCGSVSDSDILQVILSSTTCTYETHGDFPSGLLKRLPLSQQGDLLFSIYFGYESLRLCATFRSTSETAKNWSGHEFCLLHLKLPLRKISSSTNQLFFFDIHKSFEWRALGFSI